MDIDKNVNALLQKAKSDPTILAVFLFGSYLAKKQHHHDVDIALVLDEKLTGIQMAKIRLQYQANAVNFFDIQVLQLLPYHIQPEVLKGKLLYCQNYDALFEIAIKIIQQADDMKRRIQLMVSA